MNKSDSIKGLVGALAKAQAEFPAIPKDKTVTVTSKRTGAKYTFDYAPLETILHAVRPVLKKNGLAFMQSVSGDALTTLLMHTSGEWIESDPLPIKVSEDGAQALGSAITYARRYALIAALGIVAEDDDDGNAAEGNTVAGEKTGKGLAKITPREGAFDSLDVDMQTMIRDIATDVRTLMHRGDFAGALDEVNAHNLEATAKVALWDQFDSRERSALTKERERREAKERKAA